MEGTVLAVSVAEAARRLGISARTMATLLAEKKVRSTTVGRRRLIPVSALEDFLRQDVANQARRQPKVARRVEEA